MSEGAPTQRRTLIVRRIVLTVFAGWYASLISLYLIVGNDDEYKTCRNGRQNLIELRGEQYCVGDFYAVVKFIEMPFIITVVAFIFGSLAWRSWRNRSE